MISDLKHQTEKKMGSFLLFILITFLLIIGLGALFIFRFLRLFTKGAKASASFGSTHRSQQNETSSESQQSQEKVFSKDEGEYVDYEEIK